MAQIIPAIIGKNFREITSKIAQVEGLVDWVQIDVTDGHFASPETWGTADDLALVPGKVKIEVHLMIEEPETELAGWLAGADRLIVHYEASDRLRQIFGAVAGRPNQLGLALLWPTSLSVLEAYRENLKLVQLMSIAAIGQHGQPLVAGIEEKIKSLRQQFPDVTISIDGGVTLANAPALLAAGADRLVVGSALWESEDVAATIKQFQNL